MADNKGKSILYGDGVTASGGTVTVFRDGIYSPRSAAASGVTGSMSQAVSTLINTANSEFNIAEAADRANKRFADSSLFRQYAGAGQNAADASWWAAYDNDVREYRSCEQERTPYEMDEDGWLRDPDTGRKILAYEDPSADAYYRQIWAANAVGVTLTGYEDPEDGSLWEVKRPEGSTTPEWSPIMQSGGFRVSTDYQKSGNILTDAESFLTAGPNTDVSTPDGVRLGLGTHYSKRNAGDIAVDLSGHNVNSTAEARTLTGGWFRIGAWVRYELNSGQTLTVDERTFSDGMEYVRVSGSCMNQDVSDGLTYYSVGSPVYLGLTLRNLTKPGTVDGTTSSESPSRPVSMYYSLPTGWTWCQYCVYVDKEHQISTCTFGSPVSGIWTKLALRITGVTIERVKGPDTDRTGSTVDWDGSLAIPSVRRPIVDVRRLGRPELWKKFYEWCATAPQPCEVNRSAIIDTSAGAYTRHTAHLDEYNFHLLNRDDFGRRLEEEPRDFTYYNILPYQDDIDISLMPCGFSNFHQYYSWGTYKALDPDAPDGKEAGCGDGRCIVGFNATDGTAWPSDISVQVLDIDPVSHPCGGHKVLDIRPGAHTVSVYSPRVPIDSSYGGYAVLWFWYREYKGSRGWGFGHTEGTYEYFQTDTPIGMGETAEFPDGWKLCALTVKYSVTGKKTRSFLFHYTGNGSETHVQFGGFGFMPTGTLHPKNDLYMTNDTLRQIHHPFDRAGATTHYPIRDGEADEWLQMVRMPNIWCAPSVNPYTGCTEFWISIDRRLPGMIPWFNNEGEDGFPVESGKYKLLARYRGTPRWQKRHLYGYDESTGALNGNANSANGGMIARMGYNSTAGSFDYFPYMGAPWTTSNYVNVRGAWFGIQDHNIYAMTWWEMCVYKWIHAMFYGSVHGEKTNLLNSCRCVKKMVNQSNRVWATPNYMACTGLTDRPEGAYSHISIDGSVLPWGSGIGSVPWLHPTHALYDGSFGYERTQVPRQAVFMWLEEPIGTRMILTPGMCMFPEYVPEGGPVPIFESTNVEAVDNPVQADYSGGTVPVDSSNIVQRPCTWDRVRYTYSADAANFMAFQQTNLADNTYLPDHWTRESKIINVIAGGGGTTEDPSYYNNTYSAMNLGMGYVSPLGLPMKIVSTTRFDTYRGWPGWNWLKADAHTGVGADYFFISDAMKADRQSDPSFMPWYLSDFMEHYNPDLASGTISDEGYGYLGPYLWTRWMMHGAFSVTNQTESYWPWNTDDTSATGLLRNWRSIEADRSTPSIFSIGNFYSNVSYASGGVTVRLALDVD